MSKELQKPSGIRLLHISDLHLNAKRSIKGHVDNKSENSQLTDFIAEDRIKSFRSRIRKIFKTIPEEDYPTAVVVTGDLVNKGGTDVYRGGNEFDVAREFLKDLASDLRLQHDRIFVIPGNHDVDWSPGLTQAQRFKPFFDMLSDFETPAFVNGNITPLLVPLNLVKQSVSVELLLLVSPTFSGIADFENEKFRDRILNSISEPDESLKDWLSESFNETTKLDIAAIGRSQREFIRKTSATQNPIRIALLHHHLLPEPQMEITSFESVLDSGRVMDDLIEYGYDLVLTGHKHNRRLVQYTFNKKSLDVYSSPSLFYSTESCKPGFTIIDIHSHNSPNYATLHYFDTDNTSYFERHELFREGRVLPIITRECAQIHPNMQEKKLVPLLRSVNLSLDWSGGDFKNMFEDVWDSIQTDVQKLSERTLVYRPPLLHKQWSNLIELADNHASSDKTLKLVSYDDLDYWQTIRDPLSDAAKYSDPLTEFSGKKERILVLNLQKLRIDEKDSKNLINIVNEMVRDGFIIRLVDKNKVPRNVSIDFGIIGGFAVSKFDGIPHSSRALFESFSENALQKAHEDWSALCSLSVWYSNDNPFTEWWHKVSMVK